MEEKTEIKDEFCSYKTSMLAKEKGFDIYCTDCYETSNEDENIHIDTYTGLTGCEDWTFDCYRPTQSLLQRWLREKHKMIVIPFPIDSYDYWNFKLLIPDIMSPFFEQIPIVPEEYKSYEEALEAGMYYVLSKYII